MNRISTNNFSIQATPTNNGDVALSVTPQDEPALMPGIDQMLAGGDPGAMMAALAMQTAHDETKIDRANRDAAEKAQIGAERAEVQDLHDKANIEREQGWTDGALQIAQGAAEFGSGMAKANASVDSGSAKQSDERWSAGFGAGAAACKAAQSAVDGEFRGHITDKEADEKAQEASADAFKKVADDCRDAEKDAKELLNKALDFYKEYVDTKNQTAMAAIHRA